MSDPSERWLAPPEFEGFYEASDLGRIRSIRHMTQAGWRGGRTLMPFPDVDGYLRVNLSCHGRIVQRAVHQLVLEAFVGPCPLGQQARHGRGGQQDNRLVNLCWGTPLENSDDKRRDGTMACGERQGHARFTEQVIREMRSRYDRGVTQAALARDYGTAQAVVSRIVRREAWIHVT